LAGGQISMGLLDEFIGITNRLNERGIEYAVCGGWAMAIHGFLRATTDIDLLILTEDLEKVRKVAIEQGFDVDGLPLHFGPTEIRRLSKIDGELKELITLDMILVTEIFQEVWKDRQRVKWNKGEYWVVSTDGMIVMKENAGRPKDLIDIDYLRGLDNED
jgi:predicted nucleotidyltransferase